MQMEDESENMSSIPEVSLPRYEEDDPPWLDRVEQDVLGAMLHRHGCLLRGIERLRDDSFYSDVHQKLFQALRHCHASDQQVTRDLLLGDEETPDPHQVALLDYLELHPPESVRFDEWVRSLEERVERRELLALVEEAVQDIHLDLYGAEVVRSSLIDRLMEFHLRKLRNRFRSADQLVEQELESLHEGIYPVQRTMGIPSGLSGLDEVLRGWKKGGCYLLCGDPYAGSTSLALCFAMTAADQPVGVALISPEHDASFLTRRMLAIHGGLALEKIRTDNLSPPDLTKLTKAADWHRQRAIHICDDPFDSVRDLTMVCRELMRDVETDLLIIDDAQLVGGYGKEQATVEAITLLRQMAKSLECAVLILGGQMVRESERLAVDAMLMLDENAEGEATHQLRVVQHRHGQPGSVRLRMDEETLGFREVS